MVQKVTLVGGACLILYGIATVDWMAMLIGAVAVVGTLIIGNN